MFYLLKFLFKIEINVPLCNTAETKTLIITSVEAR